MAFGQRPCGQCNRRTSNGAFGEPGSDFEGQWFCQSCWDAWGLEEQEEQAAWGLSDHQPPDLNGCEAAPAPAAMRLGSQRQSFGWGPQAAQAERRGNLQRPAAPVAPVGSWGADTAEGELARSRQAFRVLQKCAVREEPDLESRKVGSKSQGGNVWGGELTVDGWLKLHGERGWILTDMRGMDGIEGVLEMLPGEGAQLAIEGYHTQGICCLEVCFVQVAVRRYPSREAPQLSLRLQGELVFARSQSFNGWVHLAGEAGWMQVSSEDFGQLLMPLYSLPHVDLWLLRDLWAGARREGEEMSFQTVTELKDVETKARLFAAQTFGHLDLDQESGTWKVAENAAQNPVEEGLLSEEDLWESHARILRKLFVVAIERALPEQPLARLVPELRRCERPVLLHVREGDEDVMEEMQGPYGPTVLFEHQGQVYLLAEGGLLLDPATHQFVGLWDAESKTVEPPPEGFDPSGGVTMVAHEGKEYVMTANGALFDSVTRQRVGVYNLETRSVELDGSAEDAEGVKLKMAWDGPLDEVRPENTETVDVEACLARAEKCFERRSYRVAAHEFGKVLDACQRSSCVDLDEEAELFRKQASCFFRLRDYARLLEATEKMLLLSPTDAQALEWHKQASQEVAKRPVRR